MAQNDAVVIDDVLEYLNMSDPSAGNRAELGQYISAAVTQVEQYCGPIIIREVTDYEVFGRNALVLDRRPVTALVSITPCRGGDPLDVSGYRVVRSAGLVRPVHGGRLRRGPFDVTYRAGWAETVADVPDALALACQVIVAHLYGDQRRPTLGPQPDYGDPYPQTTTSSGFAIPYQARDLMAPFRTTAVA